MAGGILLGLHPDLLTKIQAVLVGMAGLGHPMRVCQGVRSMEQQAALYAQGRTLPRRIVTDCDGIIRKSPHQRRADGFGHAADCCFTGSDPFGIKQPWAEFGELVKAQGLRWGGDFATLKDYDHAELA